jgi:hypothetical protein
LTGLVDNHAAAATFTTSQEFRILGHELTAARAASLSSKYSHTKVYKETSARDNAFPIAMKIIDNYDKS